MDLNAVAQDLFDELKSRYSELTLGDDTAQTTIDPQSARFFKFSWNNNAVSIALDEETLRLVYNKDLTNSLEEEQEQNWYKFARTMREFAVTHNLGFKPQDVEKLDLEQGDFEFMSQVNTVQESNMHGTSKTSYNKLDKTKMIIRHSKQVDETVPGARSRNIDVIFIENAVGERFRFPYNYLQGARAMQMHVAKGGNPYDAIGESIITKVHEIAQLRNFTKYAVSKGLLDENTQPYIDAAQKKIAEAKKTLHRLQKSTTYESAAEEVKIQNANISEEDLSELKKLFTKETFDDSIVDAFRFLPINELKPADDASDDGDMDRTDIMTGSSTASKYASYVEKFVNNPESRLILKKDRGTDELQNSLRSQQKDLETKLGTIMRDIASRFLSANREDDAVANFASDMEQQLSMSGELFSKPNPEMKRLKGTAIQLANIYLQDMKKIKIDDEYADQVRKSPEDIKAFKNIKGQEIDKGKLATQYKRKYKDESEQFEAWIDARVSEMEINLDDEEVKRSQYANPFAN